MMHKTNINDSRYIQLELITLTPTGVERPRY